MHFIYSVAALAATAIALPAQLVENNAVQALSGKALLVNEAGIQEVHKKRDQQRHTRRPVGAPTTSCTTSTPTTAIASAVAISASTYSGVATSASTADGVATSASTADGVATSASTASSTQSSTSTTATASSTATAGSTGTLSAALQQAAVDHHNLHRRNHSAPFVTWNPTIAGYAQTLAQRCNFAHDTTIGGGGYGQNIAAGFMADNITASITELWYNNEVNAYLPSYYGNEPDTSNFAAYGHFTQVIWNTTTTIGCAVADCTQGGLQNAGSGVPPYFTVCNYLPAGNIVGRFGQSIGQPLGQPTAHWNTPL